MNLHGTQLSNGRRRLEDGESDEAFELVGSVAALEPDEEPSCHFFVTCILKSLVDLILNLFGFALEW